MPNQSIAKSFADDQTWKMVKAILIAILIVNIIGVVIYGIIALVSQIRIKQAEKKLSNAMSGL